MSAKSVTVYEACCQCDYLFRTHSAGDTLIFKFSTKTEALFRLCMNLPFVRGLVVFRLDAFDRIKSQFIRDYVLSRVYVGGCVSKQTAEQRFKDLDMVAVKIADVVHLDAVHDIAVSTGITSLEFFDALTDAGFKGRFVISDKYSQITAISTRWMTKILDGDGNVVEIYCFGLVGRGNLTWKFCLSRLLYLILKDAKCGGVRNDIFLLSPQVTRKVNDGTLSHIEYDVFSSCQARQFSYVRCMNLLNLNYFSIELLILALQNIFASLSDGAILQLGRTTPTNENAVTFYQKTGRRLEVLYATNGGSELHDLVKETWSTIGSGTAEAKVVRHFCNDPHGQS